jgi:hypothetical protein
MKKAIFLFDCTGIMAKPWADAGYLCYCFDGQHPEGVSVSSLHSKILNVGMWFDNHPGTCNGLNVEKITSIVGKVDRKTDHLFVFGFPECTDLAVSGAAHFSKKLKKDEAFQRKAMKLVYLVIDLATKYLCNNWALENPVSVISTKWRKPDYKFDPFEYGGYLPFNDVHPLYPDYIKPRDAYPKKTCIWSGNGFVMPEKMPVEVRLGYSDQHKKLGGKSLKTKNIRSATPRGFAQAVFLANNLINKDNKQ